MAATAVNLRSIDACFGSTAAGYATREIDSSAGRVPVDALHAANGRGRTIAAAHTAPRRLGVMHSHSAASNRSFVSAVTRAEIRASETIGALSEESRRRPILHTWPITIHLPHETQSLHRESSTS